MREKDEREPGGRITRLRLRYKAKLLVSILDLEYGRQLGAEKSERDG